MVRVIPRVRIAPAAVLAALVAVLVVSWTPAQAAPATPVARGAAAPAESDQATFTGSFVGRPVVEGDVGARVRIYQVEVSEVFGPLDIATERVTVRSRAQLETCTDPSSRPGGGGRQGREEQPTESASPSDPASPTTPASPIDRQLRLFETTVQGGNYVVATCDEVVLASETVIAQVTRQLGAGRPPGLPTPTPDPLDDVGFLCPETDDALDVDDASSCPTLDEGQPFDRAAAPGLALVIVGLLGLVVARRLGRSRG